MSEIINIRQDDQLKSLFLPTKPFAKENYNPDNDLKHDFISSLITNKKIKNDNNDLEQILRLLLSKGRINYYNLDTEKDNHIELYSANSNDQIRSHGIPNQSSSLIGSTPITILISSTESSPVSNRM
ncbi:15302_t:CDS:2, partial [Funneliformis mosseae]